MPKILRKRKQALSTQEKRERARRWNPKGGARWIDPYPHIQGTVPEKKVYAYLMDVGIPFNFQTMLDVSIAEVDLFKWLRPDFIIPSLKLVIEVQGAWFHQSDQQVLDDSRKYELYRYAGYQVIYWWDYELEYMHPAELAAREAIGIALYNGPRIGEVITEHREYKDDSAGLRTLGHSRKDWFNSRPVIKSGRTTRKKSVLSYEPR